MLNFSINLVNSSKTAEVLYSICTFAFLIVPFLIYYIKYRKDTSLIQKYLQVFPNADEAYAAYVRDQENLNIVEPYRTRSLISIIYYLFITFIFSELIAAIAIIIYLSANGFSKDVINPESDLYNPDVYNHMASYLNLILQIIINGIAVVGVVILMWKPFKEDLKRINGKTFAYGAMGLGLLYAGNSIGTIFLTLIDVPDWKEGSTNQEAIEQMFGTSPLNIIILFFVIVIIAPILEELVFRKSIFKLFKNRYLALIVSSLAFGLLHVISGAMVVLTEILNGQAYYLDFILELIYVIPYSLMGLGIGIAYMKSSNNIVAPMFAHMLNNLLSFILSLVMVFNPELFEEFAMILINFLF